MEAILQSLQHVFSAMPLATGNFSLCSLWRVSYVHRKEVQVEEWSWMMLADWLDCFLEVVEAMLVRLEMMALVLESADGVTFETHHNHLGGGHILATVAHNLEILGLGWWLVGNIVSCWIANCDKTTRHPEMATVDAGNHTHLADDIDWSLSPINSLCPCQNMNQYPMILNCRCAIVAS